MADVAQIYWVKRIDNSRLVRQQQCTRVRDCGLPLAVALVCLAIGLLCAWQHFRSLEYGYRLEELRAQREELREWNRTLRLELASLRDPMRIDWLARMHLGLAAPVVGQWIPLGRPKTEYSEPMLAQRLAAKRVSLAD